jgi:hypothetical protein
MAGFRAGCRTVDPKKDVILRGAEESPGAGAQPAAMYLEDPTQLERKPLKEAWLSPGSIVPSTGHGGE